MKRYQIVRKSVETGRWSFVAHGAAYESDEAHDMCERIGAKGDKTRLLPVTENGK